MLCYYQYHPQCLLYSRGGRKRRRSYTYHPWQQSYSLKAYLSAGDRLCVCQKLPTEIMQPSSSTRATIVSAENQNGATVVKATFFFCHYYIVWESNNAGEARGKSWNESLKSRWFTGGSCGYTNGTKRKHFAALYSPRSCWRWLQLQPSCGSPQWIYDNMYMDTLHWYESFTRFTKSIIQNTGQRNINYSDNKHDNHNFRSL